MANKPKQISDEMLANHFSGMVAVMEGDMHSAEEARDFLKAFKLLSSGVAMAVATRQSLTKLPGEKDTEFVKRIVAQYMVCKVLMDRATGGG